MNTPAKLASHTPGPWINEGQFPVVTALSRAIEKNGPGRVRHVVIANCEYKRAIEALGDRLGPSTNTGSRS